MSVVWIFSKSRSRTTEAIFRGCEAAGELFNLSPARDSFLSVCYTCTNAIKYEKMRKYHFFICWQSPTNTNCTTLTVPAAKAEFMAIFLSEAEKGERKCSTGAFSCEAKKQPFLIFLTPSHITSLAFVQVWEHAGVYGIAGS